MCHQEKIQNKNITSLPYLGSRALAMKFLTNTMICHNGNIQLCERAKMSLGLVLHMAFRTIQTSLQGHENDERVSLHYQTETLLKVMTIFKQLIPRLTLWVTVLFETDLTGTVKINHLTSINCGGQEKPSSTFINCQEAMTNLDND